MKMMLKGFLFFAALLCFGMTEAQTVSGTVSDNQGPLPGATVVVKGTATGTTADFDGNYSISASAGDVLVFSYVGYTAQEITVGNQSTINVVLELGNMLEEVVITGYGSQQQKEITSAVVSVDEKSFNKGAINDASQLLQGKVAGLQIYNRGGNPNAGAVIRLRGLSTIGANASPLVVIDGVIGASLGNVDPSDIESINVLKDASAAAIYGSRGSSGVILVTTKKGKAGATQISYNGQFSTSGILNQIDYMSPEEFIAAGGRDLGSKTDWIDEVTRDAFTQIHNISAAGGDGSTSYRVSANIRDAEGILLNNGFEQFNTRLNFSTRALNDKLKINFAAAFTKRDQQNGFNEALRYATLYNPTAPVLAADAPYAFNGAQFGGYFETLGLFDSYNPVSIIKQNINDGESRQLNYGVDLSYNVNDNLTAYFRSAVQSSDYANRLYYRTTSLWNGGADSPVRKGSAQFYENNFDFQLNEAYATWRKSYDNMNIAVTGGYSYQKENYNEVFFSLGDFPGDQIDYIDAIEYSQDLLNAGQISANSARNPDTEIEAYFARLNMTIADNIYLNASLRREGSTKLGADNRWGTFPAVGLGADLNSFLGLEGVQQLKARASYGVTGNLPGGIGLSQEIRGWSWGGDGAAGGSTGLLRAANPDLKWEEKAELNFGIDLTMDRFTATLDIYQQTSKDFIINRVVDPAVYGFDRRFENAGQLSSDGVELALNYDVTDNYTTGIVLSRNKVVLDEYVQDADKFGNLGAPGQNDTFVTRVKVGEEIGQIWGPVWDGTVTDGSQNFVDVNGDGQLVVGQNNALDDNVDFDVLGSGIPDLELGWSNELTLGKYTINAFFRGAFGHSLVNTFRAFYEPRVGSQKSYNYINTELANDAIKNANFSSLYVEKADFFKLDNLTVSRPITDNVNLSLNVQNAFVITKYTGSDPEPALFDLLDGNPLAPGIDRRNSYYSSRSFTLGVNINF
jgi:TonB-dependent starch-binding outer membrane protein SusC